VEQRGGEERSVHDGVPAVAAVRGYFVDGDVTTRNQQIAMLFQKGDEPVSMEQRVVSVRTFGDTRW